METRPSFDVGDLLPIGMTIVILGIGLAIGLQIMGDTRDSDSTIGTVASCGLNSTGGSGGTITYTNCGEDYNATQQSIQALAKIPAKIGLIVTVVIAAVVIGILVKYLFFRQQK